MLNVTFKKFQQKFLFKKQIQNLGLKWEPWENGIATYPSVHTEGKNGIYDSLTTWEI